MATTAELETAVETLRHVIHCLRQNGSYTDGEGEAADFIEPLLDALTAQYQFFGVWGPTGETLYVKAAE
jgi:hypothetical protein